MKNKILLILSILAVGVLISSLGHTISSPFSSNTVPRGIKDMVSSEYGYAVIDDYGDRLMFLNNDAELVAVTENSMYSTSLYEYIYCTISDDNVYVLRRKYDGYTNFTDSEEVILYDLKGNKKSVVYTLSYDNKKHATNHSTAIGLQPLSGGNAILTEYDVDSKITKLIKLSPEGHELYQKYNISNINLYEAAYDERSNTCVISAYNGDLFLCNSEGLVQKLPESGVLLADLDYSDGYISGINDLDDKLYWCKGLELDNWQSADLRDPELKKIGLFENKIFLDRYDENIVFDVDDMEGKEYSSIEYSREYQIYTLAVWLSILYIGIIILYIAYININRDKLIKFVNAVSIPLVIISVTSYFYYGVYNNEINQKQKDISSECNILMSFAVNDGDDQDVVYISNVINHIHNLQSTPWQQCKAIYSNVNPVEGMSEQEKVIGEEYSKLSKFVHSYGVSKSDAELADELVIYYKDCDGTWREYADSISYYMPCSKEKFIEKIADKDEIDLNGNWVESGNSISHLKFIKNDQGENIGAIMIVSRMKLMTYKYLHTWINMIVTLLLTLLVLYFLLVEASGAVRSLDLYKQYVARKLEHVELAWCSQFIFLSAFIYGADNFLIVFIAKDILEANGEEYSLELLGVPLTAIAVAAFLSTILYSYLQSKIKFRNILAVAMVWTIFATLATMWVINMNHFWGFVFCKSLMVLGAGVINHACHTMPLKFSSEKERVKGTQGIALTKIASTAIGASVCGYVSQYLGNGNVYIALTLPMLLFLVLVWLVVPKDMIYGEANANGKNNSLKEMLTISIKPQMLMFFVAIVLPFEIFNCYSKFMFPIIGSEAELSKVDINNIIVFTNGLVFILRDVLKKATEKIDYWTGLIVMTGLLSCVYLCFVINDTIVWAVAALFVINSLDRLISPLQSIMWQRVAISHNISIVEYIIIFSYILYGIKVLPMPITGFLLGFGMIPCCLSLFAMGVAGALGFAAVTRGSVMQKPAR